MAAVQTFGVDSTHMAAFEPQITVGSDGPITSARLTIMINASSAAINGLMSYHGIDPATIAALSTSSTEYLNAQRLITDRVRLDMQAAAYGTPSIAAELTAYDERTKAELETWRAAPDTMGEDVTDDVSPGIITSTAQRGLSTTDIHQRGRRRYDRARDRTSNPDDLGGWGRTRG